MKKDLLIIATLLIAMLYGCTTTTNPTEEEAKKQAIEKMLEGNEEYLLIQKAAPIYGKKFASYHLLQEQWKRLNDNTVKQMAFILKNEEKIAEQFEVVVSSIDDADNFFKKNPEVFKEAIKLQAKRDAAMILAEEKWSEAYLKEETANLLEKITGE